MSTSPTLLSITPLGGGATFTGKFETVPSLSAGQNYPWVSALSSSDQSGTLFVEQSADGVTPLRSDSLASAADALGNKSSLLKVQVVYPYVRIRYTNGGVAQLFFVLSRTYSLS